VTNESWPTAIREEDDSDEILVPSISAIRDKFFLDGDDLETGSNSTEHQVNQSSRGTLLSKTSELLMSFPLCHTQFHSRVVN